MSVQNVNSSAPKTPPNLSQIEDKVKGKHPDWTPQQDQSKAQSIFSKIEAKQASQKQQGTPGSLNTVA